MYCTLNQCKWVFIGRKQTTYRFQLLVSAQKRSEQPTEIDFKRPNSAVIARLYFVYCAIRNTAVSVPLSVRSRGVARSKSGIEIDGAKSGGCGEICGGAPLTSLCDK